MDGGYIVLGVNLGSSNNINILKIDGTGGLLWSKTYGGTGWSRSWYMELTSDSGYVITGWTNSYDTTFQAFLLKVDANGDSIFMKTYVGQFVNPNDQDVGFGVKETKDKGFIVTGNTTYLGNTGNAALLFKTDKNGNMEWSKSYGGVLTDENAFRVMQTIDRGFIILGDVAGGNINGQPLYLIKTDSLGNIHTNMIAGNVFQDLNSNCINDSGETSLFNWLIIVDPGSMFTYTDSNGNYSLEVDTGTYTVSSVNPNSYWGQNCPSNPESYSVTFTSFYDTVRNINFSKVVEIDCPQLTIDITAPRLRICARNTYSVMYCNKGTAAVSNAYVEVTFDEYVIPITSTIPWVKIVGNVYTFDIGIVNPNVCNTFFITDSISCNAALGSRHCLKAQIFPDSICGNTDSTWDHSSVMVEGRCINDSIIKLVIKNTGDPIYGNMDTTSEYRIYINNYLSTTQQFQLAGQDSLVIILYANGTTIRIEADQSVGHPGNSLPRLTIEGCGMDTAGNTAEGQFPLGPEDDVNVQIEITCQEIVGSFDPNEKLSNPEGIGLVKYISPEDQLEYQINFQNTGNDTAYIVVIKDQLPVELDISTVNSGSSNHAYSLKINNDRILEWTFDNIMLPDSNINEPASHGFVKFKVNQIKNNPNGTLIINKAFIYFDQNYPVQTNMVSQTVYDTVFVDSSLICNLPLINFSYVDSHLTITVTNNTINSTDYLWDFGDGFNDSLSANKYTYADSGNYNLCLTASNVCGAVKICKPVSLSICFPTVSNYGHKGDFFSYTFQDSSKLAVTYLWDFGDGITDTTTNPMHIFSDTGIYNVCLTTTNSCNKDTTCKAIGIYCDFPKADFAVSDTNINVADTVYFYDSTFVWYSPVVSWKWNFGDGTFDTTKNPVHVFNNAGTYPVTLTVTNVPGCTDSITKSNLITVTSLKPSMFEIVNKDCFKINSDLALGEITLDICEDIFRHHSQLRYVVYDVLGREIIRTSEIKSSHLKIDTHKIKSGIYYCKIFDKQNVLKTGKVLIED